MKDVELHGMQGDTARGQPRGYGMRVLSRETWSPKANTKNEGRCTPGNKARDARLRRVAVLVGAVKLAIGVLQLQLS